MKDIFQVLNDLGIAYVEHKHPPLFTVEDSEKHYKQVKGGRSKNLFLRNRKGDRHYLIVIEASKQLNLTSLADVLEEVQLSFASPERLLKHLGLTPGSVSPFGLINDEEKAVVVIIDKALLQYDRLNYHPNINTATLEIAQPDLGRFLEWSGQQVRYLDL
ncbi:MAG: prolyl-tRNA synthetase associated domain-containing protein [Candidatus Kerfeldbacteria bacterium CG15_BIG_FIL_POST_REV_8_21_14_020_45_12]|uniref:Prolyl-tRNA synthetase associated domain-containing protein n=1 Tax=Candidatus Kerfeldbacteria bacterium CG15_BIG_FIL_POST_REV_8_21_14_020_45_12 TaxID=2014247 RepID=A0A2M7H2X8_9BACT|nr:MAG: prolyl-tRNA synthetase associated domain-containing protein [Candidatus Kerfeldbacteria bacterium CG15_BIG_FIL_POST_REV_8_21_14_020_45_12]PJA93359.1 MAG: prolyl-tRNA synthetase associated domain-containing protein [Candidatus Kerfeldbacteria bacterium CG_4_9_14_3_um_filter_45_8]